MKNCKHLLLLVFLSSIFTIGTYAQEETADDDKYRNVPKRLQDQKDQYDDGEYLFPPKPKNNLSVGIKGGHAFVSGDVSPQPGFGFGINLRKALGHAFSIRLEATGGQTTGLNYKTSTGYQNHAGNPWNTLYFQPNTTVGPPSVYYNFQMTYADLSIQALVNLNNINFYKEQSKWNVFAGAGIGLMGYYTAVDALRGDNPTATYDFSSIPTYSNDPTTLFTDKQNTIDAIKNTLDGDYETPAEGHGDEEGLEVGNNFYVINPVFMATLGLRYRLSRRLELEIEHRIGITNDDLLDGQRWQENGFSGGSAYLGRTTPLTRDFDSYHHTTVGLHFRLGKGEESLWWSNPLTEVYSTAQESRELVKKLTDDSDEDGIPDLYDKEPDTPEGNPVDYQGRTLDSDGDGHPDSEDDEPFTKKGCKVDNRGVAMDSDSDGVADCMDKEPDSKPGALVDAKGIALPDLADINARISQGGGVSETCIFPIIHFDLNRDAIKPEFYPELYYIAQILKNNPSFRVKATGFADNRNTDDYNIELSKRRVENTVDFLVNTYGLDRSRFEVDFEGESASLIPDLPDNYSNRELEPLHYVNRRVEFNCIDQ